MFSSYAEEKVKKKQTPFNKRNKQISEEFSYSEEETMETVSEEKVFTKRDFACINETCENQTWKC